MKQKMIDLYFKFAEQCAEMSSAKRLQVGCVVVKNNNILSFSWNGTPSGWSNVCEEKDYDISKDINGEYFPNSEHLYPHEDQFGRYRLKTKQIVHHAERNALDKIARSNESSEGAEIFVTHSPCIECAKSIFACGIKRVYYRHEYSAAVGCGLKFLQKCGIETVQVNS